MEGHVNITLLSRSRYDGGEDVLAYAGNGLLRREGESWHLRYTASAQDGSRVATDLRLESGRAIVRNITGDYTMILDKENTTQARIPTAVRTLTMDVTTRSLDWQLEEAPGRIIMD